MVGFIKAVMAVQKGQVPLQANLDRLNSKIDWAQSGVEVAQKLTQLPVTAIPRRAAICSYGYGGTVAHAIIEAFQDQASLMPWKRDGEQLLLVSASQQKRLPVQAKTYHDWLSTIDSGRDLHKVASTLSLHREHHDYRAAMIVDGCEEAAIAMRKLSEGATSQWITTVGPIIAEGRRDITWVFSGHGAQ